MIYLFENVTKITITIRNNIEESKHFERLQVNKFNELNKYYIYIYFFFSNRYGFKRSRTNIHLSPNLFFTQSRTQQGSSNSFFSIACVGSSTMNIVMNCNSESHGNKDNNLSTLLKFGASIARGCNRQ